MSTLSKKIDFAVVIAVNKANPNGDPLTDNRPRITFANFGEISDVCLKRKIRNRLQDEGNEIFVQMNENKKDEYRSLSERYQGEIGKVKPQEAYKKVCDRWLDVRSFGQVFAFKEDSVSFGVRGPVSIQPAISVEEVTIESLKITKSVNSEPSKKEGSKSSDTMGAKHRVDFGMYITYGSINTELASKTGFTDADAEAIKKALLTMFRNDSSASRPDGSMEVVKLVWWEHNCKSGQYSSAKVHRSLIVKKNDGVGEAHSMKDYSITTKKLEGLKVEVLDGE